MILADLNDLQLELFLRMREKSQIVWRTKNKSLIPINKMSDKHLLNTIKMLRGMQEIEEMDEYTSLIIDELRGLDLNDIS